MKLNYLAVLAATSLIFATASHATYARQSFNNAANSETVILAQTGAVTEASGAFVAAETPTTGMAKIVRENGHNYLELDAAFNTSDQGPDLHVLLDTNNTPPGKYDNLNGTINLGRLRSYKGVQRYPIPDVINVADYKSVVIWCRMANATFGYATLQSSSANR